MESNEKVVRIEVRGAAAVPLDMLKPFQGELKTLGREDYERLRHNILTYGYSFTIHTWVHEGEHYIIDGHQRLFTLKKMRDEEGFVVPELPISYVEAASFGEAKRKVLAGVSQYGKLTEESVMEFMRSADIPFEDLAANFSLPGIDMEKFMEMFAGPAPVEVETPTTVEVATPEMKHSSEGVKQIQLYYNQEDYQEFMQLTDALRLKLGKENVSDTLLEVLRESNRSHAN